jgi:hypothetical protein
MKIMRWLQMLTLLTVSNVILWTHPLAAQDTATPEPACLLPNFLVGSEVRVVGSLEAGGLPVRSKLKLDSDVTDFIPLNTTFISDNVTCIEGRNWMHIAAVKVGDRMISGYAVMDDGVHYWLQANRLCPVDGAELYFGDFSLSIRQAYPVADKLVIGVTDTNTNQHPVLLDYYNLDRITGVLTPATYPYADIVTRDLTDMLGITDVVFGENSNADFSLHVSPDGKQILYFVPGHHTEGDCNVFCAYVEGFVADADGSHPLSLGQIPVDASLDNVYWGTDGRIYLSHITEEGGIFFTVGICIKAGCTIQGDIHTIAAVYGLNISSGAIDTTSPNGQYLAINPQGLDADNQDMAGAYVIDLLNKSFIRLPDDGYSQFPLFWEDDSHILYGVSARGVADKQPYAKVTLKHDGVFLISLDFEKKSYSILQSVLSLPDDTILFDDIQPHWLDIRRQFFMVNGGLRCIIGGFG